MYLIENDLADTLSILGAKKYETKLREANTLSGLLKDGEIIRGAIFGHYRHYLEGLKGRGASVSTNNRLLLIDSGSTSVLYEELSYDLIQGLIYISGTFRAKLTLKTTIGSIYISTRNTTTVERFVSSIDQLISIDQELAMAETGFFTLRSL